MDTAPVSNEAAACGATPGAAIAPPNKRRWLQFRLRSLLVLVVLLCLGLGGWQIYWTHFANYVIAGPVRVGEPIKVRGQFVDWSGTTTSFCVVDATQPHRAAQSGRIIAQEGPGRPQKTGRWTFQVEMELGPLRKAGNYRLELKTQGRPTVYGKLVVLPNDEP